MVRLDKNIAVFERNEKGELMPREKVLEKVEGKPTILITPMYIHDWDKLSLSWTDAKNPDTDIELDLIQKHCIEPKFSEEDVKTLKPKFKNSIISAIIAETVSMDQEELERSAEEKKKSITQ